MITSAHRVLEAGVLTLILQFCAWNGALARPVAAIASALPAVLFKLESLASAHTGKKQWWFILFSINDLRCCRSQGGGSGIVGPSRVSGVVGLVAFRESCQQSVHLCVQAALDTVNPAGCFRNCADIVTGRTAIALLSPGFWCLLQSLVLVLVMTVFGLKINQIILDVVHLRVHLCRWSIQFGLMGLSRLLPVHVKLVDVCFPMLLELFPHPFLGGERFPFVFSFRGIGAASCDERV